MSADLSTSFTSRLMPIDDGLWGAGRREYPHPHVRIEADLRQPAFGHGRHVGQVRVAPRPGVGERANLAVADQRHHLRRWRDVDVDAAAQQIGPRPLAAAIGHADDVDVGGLPEGLAEDVRHGAKPVAERELAGIGLGVGHQLADRLGRNRRRHRQHMRPGHGGRDRNQALCRIEVEIGKQHRVVGEVRADEQQRVAVRLRRRHRFGPDGGAAARAVLDDDVLAEPALQMLHDHARQRIDRPSRHERHDHLDGLCRIGLRLCCNQAPSQHQRGRDEATAHVHGYPLTSDFGKSVAPKPSVNNDEVCVTLSAYRRRPVEPLVGDAHDARAGL